MTPKSYVRVRNEWKDDRRNAAEMAPMNEACGAPMVTLHMLSSLLEVDNSDGP